MAEYIDRWKLLNRISLTKCDARTTVCEACKKKEFCVYSVVEKFPAADVVPAGVYKQTAWERDIAIQQLREDYGVSLGEKKKTDVAPVVHERWVEVASHSLFGEEGIICDIVIEEKCSRCSTHVSRYVTELPYEYCHGCGAKMDLE